MPFLKRHYIEFKTIFVKKACNIEVFTTQLQLVKEELKCTSLVLI